MPTPRMKFNPGFRSDEEIVADFLVRHADLELVLRTIRENTGAPRNQHLLLVGPRGMGKTTLVLRAAAEVRSDPELQAAWYPIIFSEESYSVSTPGEFWLEALHHLGHQTGDARWKRAHDELMPERDETRLRERALAKLLDFADQQRKRLLLIVENLQMLMEDQLTSDDAWVIRKVLQNEPRLMLLATATSRFDQIENVDEAMYEQCLLHELRPLDDDECRQFWETRTGTALAGRQIRPIRILTGGNPRLLDIISLFAARSSFEELMTNLVQLVDDHTDYFKGHLDQLAPVERKVFVALADIWDPAPTRQVARAARLDTNRTSAELTRLASRGAVLAEGAKRSRRYQVAERMYNIYHLMRRRGDSSARVTALVRFMRAFYAPRELVGVTASVAGELQTLAQDRALDHLTFLQELLCNIKPARLRSALLDAVRPVILSLGDTLDHDTFSDLVDAVSDVGAAHAPTDEAFLAAVDTFLSLLRDPARLGEAESIARMLIASAPMSSLARMTLAAAVTRDETRLDEAEGLWRQVAELDPTTGLYLLGEFLRRKRGKYVEAADCFWRLLELVPNYVAAWRALASVLGTKLDRWPEAEQAYRRVAELEPGDAGAWLALAHVLHLRLSRYSDAEAAYRRSLELSPGNADAWYLLAGLLCINLGRLDDAAEAARRALDIDPKNERARLIMLLARVSRSSSALDSGRSPQAAVSEMHVLLGDLMELIAAAYRDAGPERTARLEEMFRALQANGTNVPLSFLRVAALSGRSEWHQVLSTVPHLLSDPSCVLVATRGLTTVLTRAAAAGYGPQLLAHLQASPSAPLLEPLICALRMDAGEEVSMAQEIMEVARDILDDIQEERKKLASPAEPNAE